MNAYKYMGFILILLFAPSISFSDVVESEIRKISDQLALTFQNLQVTNITKSPVDGLYEIYTGSRVIYYYPKKELIIFGEILDASGVNVTSQSLQLEFSKRLSALEEQDFSPLEIPESQTLGNKSVIEFIDPNCEYCRQWNYLSKKFGPNRKIVFSLKSLETNSAKKAIHVLCSEDQAIALDRIMFGMIMDEDLEDCEEGRVQLKEHMRVASRVGIEVTPSFVLVQNNNELVKGMQREKLMNYLRGN